MHERIFSQDDQIVFSKLSADYNPFHLDPLAARRLPGGAPAVHGMNALLWGLEKTIGKRNANSLMKLKGEFLSPIHPGDRVELHEKKPSRAYDLSFGLDVGGVAKAVVSVAFGESLPAVQAGLIHPALETYACRELDEEEILGRKGDFPLLLDSDLALRNYPQLFAVLGVEVVALLVSISRLVGMDCPGFHSILSSVDVDFTSRAAGTEGEYYVKRFDDRFKLVDMDFRSFSGSGTIRSFLRPKPCLQLSFADAAELVRPDVFSGRRALVVGGSRGIGEVTTKLLAAGGADVVFTYSRGQDEAQHIVDELSAAQGEIDSVRLDVLDISDSSKAMLQKGFSHLYYFASPYIFSAIKGRFSLDLYHKFSAFYVEGFLKVFNLLLETNTLESVFQPSTIAVEVPKANMGEYISAKNALEGLCSYLSLVYNKIAFSCPRLPRLATDQTTSVCPVENKDPAREMLKYL